MRNKFYVVQKHNQKEKNFGWKANLAHKRFGGRLFRSLGNEKEKEIEIIVMWKRSNALQTR